jgi:hypothetical protein
MARKFSHILVHHTASAPGVTLAELDAMHRARGFAGIGYHYVILRSPQDNYTRGYLKAARPDTRSGAHAGSPKETLDGRPWNSFAIGMAVAGTFHPGLAHSERLARGSQLYADVLAAVVHLCRKYGIPAANIRGHYEVKRTACPGDWFELDDLKADVAKALAS